MKASLAVAVVAAALVVLPVGAAGAQSDSDGCNTVNSPLVDGTLVMGAVSGQAFAEGEVVTMAADVPVGDHTPGFVKLMVDAKTVDTVTFPGSVEWEVPADGTYALSWTVGSGVATWNVVCESTPLEIEADEVSVHYRRVRGHHVLL